MCKNGSDDTSTTELWDDMSDMSLSSANPIRRFSRRRNSSGSGIMRTSTLDESIHSVGTAGRRSSSCRMPVSFDIVEIRDHAIILDESRNGPALTIDWKAIRTEVTTVQEFDCTREVRKVRLLPLAERVAILMRAGYSKENLCDHFAGCVESAAAAKKEPHPKKQQRLQQQQKKKSVVSPSKPLVSPSKAQQQQPPSQRTMYSKMRKAAKKIKKTVSSSSLGRDEARTVMSPRC